jgi:hypothetical protein
MSGAREAKRCHRPENLKGKPQDRSPEHIRKCHSSPGRHPCVPPDRP